MQNEATDRRPAATEKDVTGGGGSTGRTLPDEPLPKIRGAVCAQWREYNGKRLGPYYFLFWREGGRLRKRDIKRGGLAATTGGGAADREERRERRESHKEAMRWIKDFNRECRHLEDLLRRAGMMR